MSIGSTLDTESSFENSHTSRLDDYLSDAHQTTVNQIKQGDNQKYDSKQAINDSLRGDAGLSSAVEQSRNTIRQSGAQSMVQTSAPESTQTVSSGIRMPAMAISEDNKKQGPMTAS